MMWQIIKTFLVETLKAFVDAWSRLTLSGVHGEIGERRPKQKHKRHVGANRQMTMYCVVASRAPAIRLAVDCDGRRR